MTEPAVDACTRVTAFADRHLTGQLSRGLYWAPGRVNLIGDHIDYLGGTVLPMTLDRGTAVLALERDGAGLRIHALDAAEATPFDALDTMLRYGDWRDFVAGLLALNPDAASGPGLDLVVSGDLAGGGLSSSASFTLALALALMDAGWLRKLEGADLARYAQRVEVERVGTACGLMDQLAIVHGNSEGAVAIDCSTAAVEPVPLPLAEREVLLVHCGQERRLADGIYNRRRAELAAGLALLGQAADRIPEVAADALPVAFTATIEGRRVRHVVREQALVNTVRAAAAARDWSTLGDAMTASHASLRDDFEVSVPALDALVAAAVATPGCDGARLTGAGLGGWAVVLLASGAQEDVLTAAGRALGQTRDALRWFVARPGGRLRRLDDDGHRDG